MTPAFREWFVELFHAQFPRLFRYLDRLSGDAELAGDLAQEAFVRLYRRGSAPDAPEAWLVTVGTNLFRNARSKRARRRRLLTDARGAGVQSDPPASPAESAEAAETRQRVRRALDQLADRDRQLLLLRAEGYGYRDIAAALTLNQSSVGTMLARAKRAFRETYDHGADAP